jgi:glycine/D-amino acid oxidase-like deaminating enzyme
VIIFALRWDLPGILGGAGLNVATGHDVVVVGAGILGLASAYHILQAGRGLAPLAEMAVDRRGEHVPVGRGAPGRGAPAFGGFKRSGTNAKAGGPDYLRLFLEMKSVAEPLRVARGCALLKNDIIS